MVVAASQTAGRGRLGRSWYSPPGAGLYASLVFRSRRAAPFLTLLAGVAVADGIRHATGLGARDQVAQRRRHAAWTGRAASQDRRHPRRRLRVGGGAGLRCARFRHQHSAGGLPAGTGEPGVVARDRAGPRGRHECRPGAGAGRARRGSRRRSRPATRRRCWRAGARWRRPCAARPSNATPPRDGFAAWRPASPTTGRCWFALTAGPNGS